MGDHRTRDSSSDEFELALERYLEVVAAVAPGRHQRIDDLPDQLEDRRHHVRALADGVPHSGWPRPVCPFCRGRGETAAMPVAAEAHPQGSVGRLCPDCWGTGMRIGPATR